MTEALPNIYYLLVPIAVIIALFVLICYCALIVSINEDKMMEEAWIRRQREELRKQAKEAHDDALNRFENSQNDESELKKFEDSQENDDPEKYDSSQKDENAPEKYSIPQKGDDITNGKQSI